MTKRNTEERLEKIRILLKQKNGLIDEELKKEIISVTSQKKKDQVESLFGDISQAIAECTDIPGIGIPGIGIPNIGISICGYEYDAKQALADLGKIQVPDIVREQVRKTLSSILDPIRTTFIAEIPKYVDAVSIEQNIVKEIPRAVKVSSMKKIEQGKFVSIKDSDEMMVNPEFKQLLATGFKPQPDSNITNPAELLTNFKIGTLESDYIKNILGADIDDLALKTEKVPAIKYKPAGLFIETFDDIIKNVRFNNNENFKELVLDGYSFTASLQHKEAKSIKAITPRDSSPNWKISYKEMGNKYYLTVNNDYEYFSSNVITKNTSSYSFVGKLDNKLSAQAKNYINSDLEECESYNNDELYSNVILKNMNGVFANFNSTKKDSFKKHLRDIYPKTVSAFIDSFFSSYEKNRLLDIFRIPKIPGLDDEDINKSSNLIILNLINFIPEVSQEMLDCGKQPHPLNLDMVAELMTKKFNDIGIETVPRNDFYSESTAQDKKEPITESVKIATALLLVRVCVLENILKSLFVFDEHQYDTSALSGEVLVDFIYVKVIESLEKLQILSEIETIVSDDYDFLKLNNVIKEEDENSDDSIESISINGVRLSQDTKELKSFIRALTRRTLGYFKNLIGVERIVGESGTELLKKISGGIIYDITSDQTLTYSDSGDSEINNTEKYSQRLSNIDEESFFMLERYVDVGAELFKNNTLSPISAADLNSLKLRYSFIQGCVNLPIYQELLQSLKRDLSHITFRPGISTFAQKLDSILNKPKLGLRLVQTFYKYDSDLGFMKQNTHLIQDKLNDFNLGIQEKIRDKGSELQIIERTMSLKKMYGFYDVDIKNNKMKFYNSIPFSEQEIAVSFAQILNYENINMDELFNTHKSALLNKILNDPRYEILINKSLFVDKMPNLAAIYSNCALTNNQTDNLFVGSKKRILDMYDSALNIKNYKHKNSTDRSGGIAKKYQTDMMNIGNPNGGSNFDILQFFITTPILILKGLCQVMDPNISIASQIVNAAAAGLLFPKTSPEGDMSYPGEKVILPTVLASLALLPVNIFLPVLGLLAIGPPVTPLPGMLFWALEPLLWKLPFFQNQAANSDAARALKNNPNNRGLDLGGIDKFNCDIDQDEQRE